MIEKENNFVEGWFMEGWVIGVQDGAESCRTEKKKRSLAYFGCKVQQLEFKLIKFCIQIRVPVSLGG